METGLLCDTKCVLIPVGSKKDLTNSGSRETIKVSVDSEGRRAVRFIDAQMTSATKHDLIGEK